MLQEVAWPTEAWHVTTSKNVEPTEEPIAHNLEQHRITVSDRIIRMNGIIATV